MTAKPPGKATTKPPARVASKENAEARLHGPRHEGDGEDDGAQLLQPRAVPTDMPNNAPLPLDESAVSHTHMTRQVRFWSEQLRNYDSSRESDR